MSERAGRIAVLFLALWIVLESAAASPDEDYRRGEAAWRAGDMTGAMSILRITADGGHAPSQALLADILDKAEFNEEALLYYRKSAEQGNAQGQYGLGTMYLAGEGVKRDEALALVWFARAAEQNHVDAIKGSAQAHLNTIAKRPGHLRSVPGAVAMIKRAADQNYLPAIDWLAVAYRSGGYGFDADAKQAEAWEEKARALRKMSGDKRRKR